MRTKQKPSSPPVMTKAGITHAVCPDCGVKFSIFKNRLGEVTQLWGGRCYDCRRDVMRGRTLAKAKRPRIVDQRMCAPCGATIRSKRESRCGEYFDCIHWHTCLDMTARAIWPGWTKAQE
jgi:hypothetical protein